MHEKRIDLNQQSFTVIVEPDDGGFVAHCPELKGCWSQGETLYETLRNVADAIAEWLNVNAEYDVGADASSVLAEQKPSWTTASHDRVVTLETNVPEDIYATLRAHGVGQKTLAKQSKKLLALEYYRDRLLSLGQAARLAGMSHWDFIDFLSEHQTPVLDYNDEELSEEIAAAKRLNRQLAENR